MNAKAVYFTEPGRAELREIDIADPGDDQVQVRCVANGICMGEVSLFTGVETHRWPLPRIVGHEGIGVVTKVGRGVTTHREGDWVVCREWATLWNRSARAAPRLARPPADPSTFLAEPCECATVALAVAGIQPGDRVAVIGAGFMGVLCLQGLARCPLAELVACDTRPAVLDIARPWTTDTVLWNTPAAEQLMRRRGSFDLVLECSGASPALATASALVRDGGRLMIFAWHHKPLPIDLGDWHLRGLQVINAGPAVVTDSRLDYLARAVTLMERGVFDLTPLITHRHSAVDVQQAMENAVSRPEGYIKGVLLFEDIT